ncbi:hypothetical protein AMTR_s00045p00143380 [Amborella trichopoda]|uniref:Uncharacterized protein n=1 Tax=Amborella trichopoda TaxID=13333 RepID=W1P526_AMBTC|nr:hypothetical protein AMTR_s00045p00143380 [Amborella trichopoda]
MGWVLESVLSVSVAIVVSVAWRAFKILIWRPYKLTKHSAKQGIRGSTYNLYSGCLNEIKLFSNEARKRALYDLHNHNITPRVLTHYHKWVAHYGALSLSISSIVQALNLQLLLPLNSLRIYSSFVVLYELVGVSLWFPSMGTRFQVPSSKFQRCHSDGGCNTSNPLLS